MEVGHPIQFFLLLFFTCDLWTILCGPVGSLKSLMGSWKPCSGTGPVGILTSLYGSRTVSYTHLTLPTICSV
eukprot:11163023-Prorocentrum_lima.AAC.1